MKNSLKTALTLCCLIMSYIIPVESQADTNNAGFINITYLNGLTTNTIYDLETDPSGSIWIGTATGLSKYDGYYVKNYFKEEMNIRSNTITQMEEEYVLTAVSKGIGKKGIMYGQVLKNCMLPVITVVGSRFGTLVTGSFIVESVFNWPGLGTLAMSAINNRDYPVVMGITMFSCTILLLGNFLADILYGFADPRIKIGKE